MKEEISLDMERGVHSVLGMAGPAGLSPWNPQSSREERQTAIHILLLGCFFVLCQEGEVWGVMKGQF